MSENAPEQEQATATEAEAPAEEAKQESQKPTETVDFWKSKAREQEKRAKDNAEAAAKLKEIEDAAKSEAERTTEKLTAAETRASTAESRADRLEVALEKGLTPSQAKRLVGATREELEADADELLRDLGEASKARPPKPDPTQGRAPDGKPLDPRAADLAQIEADLKVAPRR